MFAPPSGYRGTERPGRVAAVLQQPDGYLRQQAAPPAHRLRGHRPRVLAGKQQLRRQHGPAASAGSGRRMRFSSLCSRMMPPSGAVSESQALAFRRARARMGRECRPCGIPAGAYLRSEFLFRCQRTAEHILRRFPGSAVCGKDPRPSRQRMAAPWNSMPAVGEQGIADTRTELQIFDLLRRGTGLVVRCGLFERILRDRTAATRSASVKTAAETAHKLRCAGIDGSGSASSTVSSILSPFAGRISSPGMLY